MTATTFDPGKVCANCPAYLPPDRTNSKFKKSIGAPMCGRYGTVLGKPGLASGQATKLQTYIANHCDAYGQELPPLPVDHRFEVAMPDLDARERSATVEPSRRDLCRTCATCENFIRDDVVAEELGWTTGMCAAKGRLIFPTRQVQEAKDCEYRVYGQIRRSTLGIHLLPEYDDAFQLNVDPVKAYFKNKDTFVEPHEWETERPVSDDDKKSGIRAWRKVVDPAGSGNEAFLPVYDPEFFDEEERNKIPRTGDDEHPELYIDHFGGIYRAAVLWTELDETPIIWGEAGVGKTELLRHLAWLMVIPFERISITAETEIDELAGKSQYSPEKGTYFQYGRLPRAWVKPCLICLDEPNVGPPEVWHFCRPLTDNSKQLVLDMNEGERLTRHTDCYLGMTANPPWDPRNISALQIADADANRLMHIYIELPPPTLEREIIRHRVKLDGWEIDDPRLDTIMSIAEEIRGLSKEGTLPITWSIRPQIKVARASRWFGWTDTYRLAIGDYLEPEAQQALMDVVRAHVES